MEFLFEMTLCHSILFLNSDNIDIFFPLGNEMFCLTRNRFILNLDLATVLSNPK